MSTVHSIDQHPDILALRADYERKAETPVGQFTFGFTLLTALYVAVSPWIVGFDATSRLTVNNVIVGLTAAVLAIGFGSALERTHGMMWTLPLLGVWQIICLWILRDLTPTAGMIWSNCVAGGLIVLCGLVGLFFGRARDHVATR
ncbi:MAG TPA: SPW repeat protein [Mycobacterium sp.]|nr:SPW repeat protein [Mycobacterium sp.]